MPGPWRLRPAIGLPVLVAWAFALCAEAEGHVVAGWGANFNAELGAGYRSGNVTSPVEGAVRGAVKVV